MQDDNRETKDKIELNSEFGKLAREARRKRIEKVSKMSDKEVSGFSEKELEQMARLNKKYRDERFVYSRMLLHSVAQESKNQIKKWGIQEHTLAEWLMYTTEELGELSKAISEFMYREGKSEEIYKEAIQVATLSLKIAEMIEIQE